MSDITKVYEERETNVLTNKEHNVFTDKNVTERMEFTLSKIYEVVTKSYGPEGGLTAINKRGDSPIITKDGYTILQHLDFNDPINHSIKCLIEKISQNLVKTTGDGSTSAIVAAYNIYLRIKEIIDSNKYMAKEIYDTVGEVSNLLIDKLHSVKQLTDSPENLYRAIEAVATIANNNNPKIGNYVATLLKKIPATSYIKVETNPEDTEVIIKDEIKYGFPLDCIPTETYYLGKKQSLTVERALVGACYEFTKDLYDKLKTYRDNELCGLGYFVIIAQYCDESTLVEMYSDVNKQKFAGIVLRPKDLSNSNFNKEFYDALAYLDLEYLETADKFIPETNLRVCNEVIITPKTTTFVGGAGIMGETPIFKERMEELLKDYENTPKDKAFERGMFQLRLNKINAVNIKILVGGKTYEEKEHNRYLVEDSIGACRSAIKFGYTLGGNFGIYYAANSLLEDALADDGVNEDKLFIDVLQAFESAYYETATFGIRNSNHLRSEQKDELCMTIDDSAKFFSDKKMSVEDLPIYNLVSRRLETLKTTTVLAPIETDIQIISATTSIINLMLTTNQILL